MLADARFILPGRELDEEVAGVHGEEGGEEVAVGDLVGTDGVAVAAGAGVDADVGAFGGGEAGQDAVLEVDESAKSNEAPVQGLRGSFLDARWPLVVTRLAIVFHSHG